MSSRNVLVPPNPRRIDASSSETTSKSAGPASVAHRLIVGQVESRLVRLFDAPDKLRQLVATPPEDLAGIADELLAHTQRADDQTPRGSPSRGELAMTKLTISNCTPDLPSPNEAKMARRPPSTAQWTISR